jgi:hypothetical protein
MSDASYSWLGDALAARPKAMTGSDWLLIDLRRLRGRPTPDMPAGWRQLVQAYDLIAVAPKLTPAFVVGPEQGR